MKYKEEHMLRTFNSPYLPNHFHSMVVYSPILLSTLGALGFFLASLLIPDGWREAATARNYEPRKHHGKLYQNVSAVYQMIDMSRVDLSARVSFFRLRGPVASCSPSKIFWNALQSEKQLAIDKASSICVHDIYLLLITWSAIPASSFISSRSCLLGEDASGREIVDDAAQFSPI